jgi:beta-glucan synthesis-associated protein KRE6
MSDEFNTPNRTFGDGHDPVWTALEKSDDDASSAGGGSMQFYNASAVRTNENGMLEINTYLEKTSWTRYDHVEKKWVKHTTNFTSGMVQSWNKFCFTGGIVEFDVILPGVPYIGGLWPAIWMLGNLGKLEKLKARCCCFDESVVSIVSGLNNDTWQFRPRNLRGID